MKEDRTIKGKKKPYTAPKLLEYGSVTKLTESKGGTTADGKSGMVMMQQCL